MRFVAMTIALGGAVFLTGCASTMQMAPGSAERTTTASTTPSPTRAQRAPPALQIGFVRPGGGPAFRIAANGSVFRLGNCVRSEYARRYVYAPRSGKTQASYALASGLTGRYFVTLVDHRDGEQRVQHTLVLSPGADEETVDVTVYSRRSASGASVARKSVIARVISGCEQRA